MKQRNIIFVGNPVPEEMVKSSSVHNVNIADNIAQNTMIKGLHQYYGDGLKVVSVSSLKNPDVLDLGYGVDALMISSSNAHRAIYYLSITWNYTKKLIDILKENPNQEAIIITNGSYIYMALPIMLARLRYGIKWIPFLVGSVEIPEARFPYSVISKMSRWTSKRADGVITYVAKSAIDYMPGKPFVEIFYLIEEKLMRAYRDSGVRKTDKFTIVYTGALTSIYNIDIVIEVIKKTGNKYHWIFAGLGQYSEEIQELSRAAKYDVNYVGTVSNIEAVELQKSADLLLCLKGGYHSRVNQYYSKYAASGKLIEYLCSGTPILAGDIPGFSDKIKPFMTCENSQTPDNIISDIGRICDNYAAKKELAKKGQAYAFKHFTSKNQNKKIYEFLESL